MPSYALESARFGGLVIPWEKGVPDAQVEARRAVFEFLEGWYNLRRRHSALGYRSPAEIEKLKGAA